MNKNTPIPIYCQGKPVGRVVGDTFYKIVYGSKHFLKIPKAIAFDVSTLHDALNAGATKVQVTDIETGNIYKASISHIFKNGFRVNRGWGEQVALVFDGFIHIRKGHLEQITLFVKGVPTQ